MIYFREESAIRICMNFVATHMVGKLRYRLYKEYEDDACSPRAQVEVLITKCLNYCDTVTLSMVKITFFENNGIVVSQSNLDWLHQG